MSSSFYEDASLVMIPSGYKTSKVYCAKPTDGAGDLTFTRSNSTASRVASNGLIEKVRTNLFQFSEQLSNAYWGKTAAGTALAPVITENFAPAPDGSNTAERAYFNAVGTSSTDRSGLVRQLAFTTGQTYTISVYAKSATGANQILQFRLCGSQVGSEKTVTNNWQRFTETFTATTSITDDFGIQIRGNNSVNTSDLILWGFQLELSDVMTDYIPTTSAAVSVGPVANVPRLDYLGSSCPRLLLEPQRTNIQINSENFSALAYENGTITSNNTTSPDGYVNADLYTENTTNSFHRMGPAGGQTYTNGTTYTFSVFAKANGTGRYFCVNAQSAFNARTFFDLNTGVISLIQSGSATITNYGNGWYRCTVTGTRTSGTAYDSMYFGLSTGLTDSAYTGNGTNGFWGWGVQIENSAAYATSYIPTLGAAVTRGADACSKTGISSLIGQTQGTLFAEATLNRTGVSQNIELGDGTANNRIDLRLNSNNNYQLVIVQGGVVVFNQISSATFAQGETVKIAAAYKSGDSTVVYVNGVAVAGGTAGTITGSLSAIFNGSTGGTLDPMNSPIKQLLVFKTRLSNSDLAALTTL